MKHFPKLTKIPLTALTALLALTLCAAAAEGDRVTVAANEYYDNEEGCFVIIVPELSGREIFSTVADGMVTTGRVSLSVDDYSDIELYREGEIVPDPDLSSITEPGAYTLSITGIGMDYQPLTFRIVPSLTGVLQSYTIPAGFSATGVTRDGAAIASPPGKIDLTQEGDYAIDYVCIATGDIYHLALGIDHTPPVLALAELDENGIARGPVSVADAEKGSVMVVRHNGKDTSPTVEGLLRETGDYNIILTDSAGNTTEYVFRIAVYFSFVTVLAFLLLAAVITAMCLYLAREKKKLRVR